MGQAPVARRRERGAPGDGLGRARGATFTGGRATAGTERVSAVAAGSEGDDDAGDDDCDPSAVVTGAEVRTSAAAGTSAAAETGADATVIGAASAGVASGARRASRNRTAPIPASRRRPTAMSARDRGGGGESSAWAAGGRPGGGAERTMETEPSSSPTLDDPSSVRRRENESLPVDVPSCGTPCARRRELETNRRGSSGTLAATRICSSSVSRNRARFSPKRSSMNFAIARLVTPPDSFAR